MDQEPPDRDAVAARARSSWARLIHKVYEVDLLECPKCQGPMRVITLIEDAAVIRRILEHLGLWAPWHQVPKNARSPPMGRGAAGHGSADADTEQVDLPSVT